MASTAEREMPWSLGCDTRLARQAATLDFDVFFALAQWTGRAGGIGNLGRSDRTPFPDGMLLISTVHVLHGWDARHIAGFSAMLDDMTGGRWGMNIVTGCDKPGFSTLNMAPPEHDRRYRLAEEFIAAVEQASFCSGADSHRALAAGCGRPVVVNAGASQAGLDFAARHADLVFVTGSNAADHEQALASQIARIKERASLCGRQVKCIANPYVICRDTERDARLYLQHMLEGEDDEAVDGFMASILGADAQRCGEVDRGGWIGGDGLQIVGSPEQVVDRLTRLKAAGCDGVQINFLDFEPDLEFFGKRVLPLMRQAGLRQ